MATKRRELAGLSDQDMDEMAAGEGTATPGCLGKADLDEPLFILRAQDRCAPATVRSWAERAKGAGAPAEKVNEAMVLAVEMEAWQDAHPDRVKFPD